MKKLLIILFSVLCVGLNAQTKLARSNNKLVRYNNSYARYEEAYLAVLNDGNTVAWFKDASEDCTTDGQDSVTVWTDALNSETLEATDGTGACPYLDGDTVKFDGVANYLDGTFTWGSPNNLYIVIRQDSWTLNERMFGDCSDASGTVYVQQRSSSPNFRLYGNAGGTDNEGNLAVGDWGMIQVVLTTSSNDTLRLNEETAIVASITSAGRLFGGGIMLGSEHDFGSFGDVSVVEVICRKISDTATDRALIYNYLKDKYGF